MAVDQAQILGLDQSVRLYDVNNVAPSTTTDPQGNVHDSVVVTFSVAGIADQTLEFALKGLTVPFVQSAIVQKVKLLLGIFDIEGPMVALDDDGKPIIPAGF